MTTPMVHHHVDLYNNRGLRSTLDLQNEYLKLNDLYYQKLGENFKKILDLTKSTLTKNVNNNIIVDCANGIGSVMTDELIKTH